MVEGDRVEGPHLVLVGASAGGVEALTEFVGRLSADLDAAVLVVIHLPRYGVSVLPQILTRAGPLPAHHASDGEVLVPRSIFVGPPDRHLLVDAGRVQLSSEPLVNGHRPAIDPLFASAAAQHGSRVTGVILSGMLDDGVHGLRAVADAGGTTFAQSPDTAAFDSMPRKAMHHARVDQVLSPGDIAAAVSRRHHPERARPADDGRWRRRER